MKTNRNLCLSVLASILLAACGGSDDVIDDGDDGSGSEPTTCEKIEWQGEASIVSNSGDTDYRGYARAIELQDGRIMLVYGDAGYLENGGIIARYSSDGGLSWSDEELIHPNIATHDLAVPDFIQLSDGTLLVCVNPRPCGYQTTEELYPYHFEIGVLRKPVGGTWSAEYYIPGRNKL